MPAPSYRAGVFTYDYVPCIGGGGRHVAEVCRRLEGVLVVSGQANDLPDHLGALTGWRHGFCKQLALTIWLNWNLRALIRRYGLRSINIHTGPGGLFLLRNPGVPVLATAHHTYHQQTRHMRGQWWKRVLIPLERRTLRLAECVLCVSEDTRRAVVDHYRVPESATEVVPNGIDTAAFVPSNAVEKRPKSVLFLSRLEQRKGVEFLLAAFRKAASTDPDLHLYIGGKGSLRAALEQRVRERGMLDRVTFLGFVPDAELVDWYRRVTVFVMPSVFEGFGIPVLEAMAVGTPVIGTDVDGIRGLIEHDVTGLKVAYGDEAALAEAILRVCRGGFTPPADLADRIRAAYDWDTIAGRYRERIL